MPRRQTGLAELSKPERAIAQMAKPLKQIYLQVSKLLNDTGDSVLQSLRDLGELVQSVREDPETYSGGSVELLAQACNRSASELYKAQAFLESYTMAEFRELRQLRSPGGMRLNWSHVVHLLGISDKKARLKFQQLAIDKSWNSDELHKAIQEKYGNRREGSGRKFVKPKTVTEGLQNYCAFTGELVKRTEQVWSETLDELAEIPPGSHTAESRANLRQLIASLGRAIEISQTQRDKCQRVLDRAGTDEETGPRKLPKT